MLLGPPNTHDHTKSGAVWLSMFPACFVGSSLKDLRGPRVSGTFGKLGQGPVDMLEPLGGTSVNGLQDSQCIRPEQRAWSSLCNL
jgi:hypothetical protein